MNKIVWRFTVLSLLLFCLSGNIVESAEYNGQDIDGYYYADAYSYSTHKYYSVDLEIYGMDFCITFSNGSSVYGYLDDDVIDDPTDIPGTDSRGIYWSFSIDL